MAEHYKVSDRIKAIRTMASLMTRQAQLDDIRETALEISGQCAQLIADIDHKAPRNGGAA